MSTNVLVTSESSEQNPIIPAIVEKKPVACPLIYDGNIWSFINKDMFDKPENKEFIEEYIIPETLGKLHSLHRECPIYSAWLFPSNNGLVISFYGQPDDMYKFPPDKDGGDYLLGHASLHTYHEKHHSSHIKENKPVLYADMEDSDGSIKYDVYSSQNTIGLRQCLIFSMQQQCPPTKSDSIKLDITKCPKAYFFLDDEFRDTGFPGIETKEIYNYIKDFVNLFLETLHADDIIPFLYKKNYTPTATNIKYLKYSLNENSSENLNPSLDILFKTKYLKYKAKYLKLKKQLNL